MAGNVVAFRPARTRRYEAASQANRLSGWKVTGTDANAAINNPALIRNRCRDLVRNEPWAAKIKSAIVNNTIGYGIRASIVGPKTKRARLAKLWSAWAETTACDADGRLDLYGIQQLVMGALVESGECLIRLRPRRIEDGLPVPMQVQVLEPDYLADTKDQLLPNNSGMIRRGIEFDAIGRRVAYHLYRYHPGNDIVLFNVDTSRVPADEIIHVFRVDRPGQIRGVPWLAPAVVTLREMGIFDDAYLKRQQIANLFAGFFFTEETQATVDEIAEAIPEIEPGTMYALPPGVQFQFNDPPKSDPYALDYVKAALRRVAAAVGISYEALTGDLSEVNFSSARMGAQEMGRNIESWQWTLMIPLVCEGVFRWFLAAAEMIGYDTANISAEWTPPARVIVDPAKEWPPLIEAIRAGLITPQEAIRSLGYDPEIQIQQISEFMQALDDAGVILDIDPRHVSKSGVTQNANPQNGSQASRKS